MTASGDRGLDAAGEANAAGKANPAGKAESTAAGLVSIVLNGERRSVGVGLSVAALLRRLELEPGMVVVERNREILQRRVLDTTPVEEGDRIELVHFVGGG